MAEVYASVLGLDGVGAGDHFFLLGGDSLRAMRVVARIEKLAGVELPWVAVFESPTVEELARALAAARAASSAA